MVDVPLRGAEGVHNWFWHPEQDHAVHPVEDLVEMYYQSVGRNCNFVMGEVVTPEGLVPQSDIDHLAKFGREIRRRFKSPIIEIKGEGELLEMELPWPQQVNHVVIMEDITEGERIREYSVEGLTHNNRWQKLCDGQSVGHKRIQKFPERELSRVRLRVKGSIAQPLIRKLAIYRV
jgi:alpha-L-fucosidase